MPSLRIALPSGHASLEYPSLSAHANYMYSSDSIYSSDTTRSQLTLFNDEKDSPKGDGRTTEPATQVESIDEFDHVTNFPNTWTKIRYRIREPAAEFLGTMVMIIFGTGVACQTNLSASTAVSASPKGEYLSVAFGWAIGVALGVWVSGGISGGHINPAVTLVRAIFRGFSWKKVPVYILAQILGALAGSSIVYGNYNRAIDLFEGGPGMRTVPGTAALFATFAVDYLSDLQCFFSNVLCTGVLIIVALAANDKQNNPPPKGLAPLVLFLAMLGEGACLGMQTSYALNPARDLGPRLMCWLVGYGNEVWTYRTQYWLYAAIIGPIVGAILGAIIHDAFLYTGPESFFNKPNLAALQRRARARSVANGKVDPSGMDAV